MPFQPKRVFFVLASQSPRRSSLLRQAGYQFEVHPSHAQEKDAAYDDVHDIVVENAVIKGNEVIKRLAARFNQRADVLLLAADTLVCMGEKVYSKPNDLNQARLFMRELGGRPHQVLTGVFLYHFVSGVGKRFCETTQVCLKVMDEAAVSALFARVNPLDKAAGYGFQDAPEIVSSLEGSASNVIGLPMERLAEELARWQPF